MANSDSRGAGQHERTRGARSGALESARSSEHGGGQLHVGILPRLLELLVDRRRVARLVLRFQRLREAEERPAVARMEREVVAIDGLGIGSLAGPEQFGA